MGLDGDEFKGHAPSCRLRTVLHKPHAHHQRRNTARLVLAGLLVLALLWTQSLGLWHRLIHFDAGHTAKLVQVQKSPSGKLFSNHQTDVDCQLFDQLSHTDGAAATAVAALGLAVLPHILRASHGLAVARWHALFQARGPPSVR